MSRRAYKGGMSVLDGHKCTVAGYLHEGSPTVELRIIGEGGNAEFMDMTPRQLRQLVGMLTEAGEAAEREANARWKAARAVDQQPDA